MIPLIEAICLSTTLPVTPCLCLLRMWYSSKGTCSGTSYSQCLKLYDMGYSSWSFGHQQIGLGLFLETLPSLLHLHRLLNLFNMLQLSQYLLFHDVFHSFDSLKSNQVGWYQIAPLFNGNIICLRCHYHSNGCLVRTNTF